MIIPDSNKTNPRADSFTLYLNFVANTILNNILPKGKLDNKLHKTIRDRKNAQKKVTEATMNNN